MFKRIILLASLLFIDTLAVELKRPHSALLLGEGQAEMSHSDRG